MSSASTVGTIDWTRRTGGHLEPGQRRGMVVDLARVHVGNAIGRLSLMARVNRGRKPTCQPGGCFHRTPP